MSTRFRHVILAGLCVCLCFGMARQAQAFFPFGGFDQFNRLVFYRWPYAAMNDTNHDRDISGPDEGIEILLEGGPLGWTDEEIEIVKEAFQVWQDVPTAYVGFQFIGTNQDPIPLGPALFGLGDLINYVAIETPYDLVTAGVGGGILGVTILTPAPSPDEGTVSIEGIGFTYSPGQIIEADIIISAEDHRILVPGQEPIADLLGTMVHEIGHFIGMGHTPLNNLEVSLALDIPGLVETPAVAVRDASGQLSTVGATPTMFPIYFVTDYGRGEYTDGGRDLAPDDISGVSFLYPRGSQDDFFAISHEARTQSRANFPSIPVVGGHVVAWCDTDNDALTPRIPLFSTMSGLYEYQPLLAGLFDVMGLRKTLETVGGTAPFMATYTLTNSPLNSLDFTRQAPIGYLSGDFDSIDGGVDVYNPAFPSEVFHEEGNLFGTEKHDVGTPLAYDPARQQIISADSQKSLPTILAGMAPMFGDRNNLCPLNITMGSLGSSTTPRLLRRLRDNVLLESAFGTALVDAYYHVAPALARFLLTHVRAFQVVRAAVRAADWVVENYRVLAAALLGLALLGGAFRRHRKAAVIACIALAIACFMMPAHARILELTEEDMVSQSDAIVTGTVHELNSHWHDLSGYRVIVTDVTIAVTDTVKGVLGKSATINVRYLGGRVGDLAALATEMPTFREAEEVLLYLQEAGNIGYVVLAGLRGKYQVKTDGDTGEKYLHASALQAKSALARVASSMDAKESRDGKVPLDKFKEYLRAIVREQEKTN